MEELTMKESNRNQNGPENKMKKFKNGFFYLGTMGGFSALIYWIVVLGAKLDQGKNMIQPISGKNPWEEFQRLSFTMVLFYKKSTI